MSAGIPVVMFNAGVGNWQQCGGMEYFGQDETIAGEAAGKRLAAAGAKHVLCVLQAHGPGPAGGPVRGRAEGPRLRGHDDQALRERHRQLPPCCPSITAKLTQDKTIDAVITLGAPFALIAIQAVSSAHSTAKLYTFDTNAALIAKIKSGQVQWAVDQQPYLQGYESVDSLWLYLTNANVLGGGETVLTGPAFIDASNVAKVAQYAQAGNR